MSASDTSDGPKGPKKKPDIEKQTQPVTPAGKAESGKEKETAAPAEDVAAGKTATASSKRTQESGTEASSKKTGEAAKPTPPPAANDQPKNRRGLRHAAAVFAAIVIGGPGLFLLCASQSGDPVDVAMSSNGAAVSCAPVAGHFTDCYLSEEVTVSVSQEEAKSGFERFCCDYIVDRSVTMTASYGDAAGALPATLGGESNVLELTDGARLNGKPVLHSTPADLSRTVAVSGTPEFMVPGLDALAGLFGRPATFDPAPLIAGLLPDTTDRVDIRREVPLTDGGTVLRITGGTDASIQISVRGRTEPSRLVANVLANGTPAERILLASGALPPARDGWLLARIEEAASADHATLRAAYRTLETQSVSRLAASTDALEAGRACIALYGALRAQFSRYDAAVATYVAARPTGLLTSLSPVDPHGCRDSARPELSQDLVADWTALNAPFVELVIPPVEQDEAETPESGPSAEAAVRKFLVDFASAAKSGARLQDLKAAIGDPVAVSFGRDGTDTAGARDSLIRMLHRQWSHVGCWIYAAAPGAGGSAMLLAEAQYPYLNRIVLGFDPAGQVTRVEVTGVSFGDLLRFKAANRGRDCQQFLNRVRLADYRDWFAANPAGTSTPVDHAERLFNEGLQQRFRLN